MMSSRPLALVPGSTLTNIRFLGAPPSVLRAARLSQRRKAGTNTRTHVLTPKRALAAV
jgi:hypothetical protein